MYPIRVKLMPALRPNIELHINSCLGAYFNAIFIGTSVSWKTSAFQLIGVTEEIQ